MGITAVILGCKGLKLSDQEKSFFRETNPFGFILFARNIDTPAQVQALVSELKSCVSHDRVPILIDQEGGRVQRMRPPHWRDYLCGKHIGDEYVRDHGKGLRLAWLQSRLIAADLLKLGINVDCLPVLDVPIPGSDNIIGDRAYGTEPGIIGEVGQAAAKGLLDGGVLPVMKHIPGHGRAMVDSHLELPSVDASEEDLERMDFEPFRMLSHLPLAMTAHVVYTSLDAESPATTSRTVVEEVIRGKIGFDGLLMSDDLSMQALSGDFCERAKSVFEAGCDVVLHCNGEIEEMKPAAEASPQLVGRAFERAMKALNLIGQVDASEYGELQREFESLTGTAK